VDAQDLAALGWFDDSSTSPVPGTDQFSTLLTDLDSVADIMDRDAGGPDCQSLHNGANLPPFQVNADETEPPPQFLIDDLTEKIMDEFWQSLKEPPEEELDFSRYRLDGSDGVDAWSEDSEVEGNSDE
jgi:hypothetical protein